MTEIDYKTLNGYLQKETDYSSLYLIYGEDVLVKSALNKLLDILIPEKQGNLNYEPVDGADGNVPKALEKVNTYSMLSGRKVVVLGDSKIFYSKQDHGIILQKAKEAYDNDTIKKAAKFILSLMGLLQLSFDDLTSENRYMALNPDGEDLGDLKWLERIIEYCIENKLTIPKGEDSLVLLEKAIEKGFPKNNHLFITTDIVDKRRKLYKIIKSNGVIINCAVPKGGSMADKRVRESVMKGRMKEALDAVGKKMDNDAFLAMSDMTGFNLGIFSNNLEKLISYTGDRDTITTGDVTAVLDRTKKDPVYKLMEAVADRNVEQSLFFLNSLLVDNFHPLQILAAITNQIRKLLLIKGFVQSSNGDSWHGGLQFGPFKSQVIPKIKLYDKNLLEEIGRWDVAISGDENNGGEKRKKRKPLPDIMVAKNPNNPYPVYKAFLKAEKFTNAELTDSIQFISRADLQLKSTGQNPRLILENTIFNICRRK